MRARPTTTVRLLLAAVVYSALLSAATYPQVRFFDSRIAKDVDPFFSIWRLAWVAHQLPRAPAHLFDTNIFFPERHTLAYSDALPAPAALAAPLFWLHVNPVLIYNLWLFAGFVLSGVAAFVLVEDLTGSAAAALVAGALFTCAPFRFEHYMHLELQLTFCMPLGLLALHRVVKDARWRDAVILGGSVALQTLCSIYYGVYFGTFLGIVGLALFVARATANLGRRIMLLGAAGILAVAVVAPYLIPYLAARDTVGPRAESQVQYYSAVPGDYLSARSDNVLYGPRLTGYGGEERHLFTGLIVVALAVLALWPPVSRTALVYLTAGVFAFDASLGLNGHVFGSLRALLLPYRGLRVPARFAILVVLSLVVLAGIGFARVSARLSRTGRAVLTAVTLVGILLEGRTSLVLAAPPVKPSVVDVWLKALPARSVLLELPLPPVEQPFQLTEGQHIYDSIFHWQPLVNGISGFWPRSYFELLEKMQTFPDAASIAYLTSRNVRFIVMRQSYFERDAYERLRDQLSARPDLTFSGRFPELNGEAVVFEVTRSAK